MTEIINKQFVDAAYEKSIQLLKDASTQYGFLASLSDKENYKRIWARDGIICGLAGLLSEDDKLIYSLEQTLLTLEKSKGAFGQVPSNVKIDRNEEIEAVSYGGIAGRVDTVPLFIIGVCNYAKLTGNIKFAEDLGISMKQSLDLLTAWEFNGKGLVYVPQSGDWADEYIMHGYILFVQLLRLWALRCYLSIFEDKNIKQKEKILSEIIINNYWLIEKNINSEKLYHQNAYRLFLQENPEPEYALPVLAPSGYLNKFDPLSNALIVLLDLANSSRQAALLNYGQRILSEVPHKMVPSFWKPIMKGDVYWNTLASNYSNSFKNKPYHYHNGGAWPMVNGWWGMALNKAARKNDVNTLLGAVASFVKKNKEDKEWGFFEYADSLEGKPFGTSQMAWSAAGLVMLYCSLEGKKLFYG